MEFEVSPCRAELAPLLIFQSKYARLFTRPTLSRISMVKSANTQNENVVSYRRCPQEVGLAGIAGNREKVDDAYSELGLSDEPIFNYL